MSDIFPFPMLTLDRIDYVDPKAYSADVVCKRNVFVDVVHTIKTKNLVASLVAEADARFFSTISLTGTIHRETATLRANEIEVNADTIVGKQEIKIPSFRSVPEIYINCGVVMRYSKSISLGEDSGLSDFFLDDEKVYFPQNSLIAQTGWQRIFSMSSLFSIRSDPGIEKEGSFKCVVCSSPLKIDITMDPELFNVVENKIDSPARSQVICTALTLALAEIEDAHIRSISKEPDDTDLQLLEQAEGLKSFLETKKIPTWEDSNFNAAYSASLYKPAIF